MGLFASKTRSARWRNVRLSWGRNMLPVKATASTEMLKISAPLSKFTHQLSSSKARISSRRTRSLSRSPNRCLWLQRSRELFPRLNCSKCRRWKSLTSTHRTKALWRSSLHHAVRWLAINSIRRLKITSRKTWWWWERFFLIQQWTIYETLYIPVADRV